MDNAEFNEMHANCIIAMRGYFVEAEKTTDLLAKCTVEPLPFAARFDLLSQEIREHEAQTKYTTAKRLLYNAARVGYGLPN
jgi:hypothetical protein